MNGIVLIKLHNLVKVNVAYMHINAEPQEFIVNWFNTWHFANHSPSEMSVAVQIDAAKSWTNAAGLSGVAEHCVTTLQIWTLELH